MFALFVFLMAEITEMRKANVLDTWVPSKMVPEEPLPKIAGFASERDPAKIYANLLLQYTKQPDALFGILEKETTHESDIKCQWFENGAQAGYFCKHGDFVSFVAEKKNIISNLQKLKEILDSFKAKYRSITNWTLPAATTATATPQKEPEKARLRQLVDQTEKEGRQKSWTREQRLQEIADTLKKEQSLTVAALLEADSKENPVRHYVQTGPVLPIPAAPHIHPYDWNQFPITSTVFECQGMFIVFDALVFTAPKNKKILFRPHAHLAYKDNLTMQQYQASLLPIEDQLPWFQWPEITSTMTWADDTTRTFYTGNFILHDVIDEYKKQVMAVSSTEPEIGTLDEILQKGPFVSEIIHPAKYKAKTLHIFLENNSLELMPKNPNQLLEYFSKLSAVQQKFIIKQLFPFLTL